MLDAPHRTPADDALAHDQAEANRRIRAALDGICEIGEEMQYAPEGVTADEHEDSWLVMGALEAGLQKLRDSLAARRGSRAKHLWARALADEVRP